MGPGDDWQRQRAGQREDARSAAGRAAWRGMPRWFWSVAPAGHSGGIASPRALLRRCVYVFVRVRAAQTYDYRVVHLDPKSSLNGITRSRVLHETHIIMEFCDRGSLQVRPAARAQLCRLTEQ
jgi:hypothetical protein